MFVKNVMSESPVVCKPSDRIDKVARLMLDNRCGLIPVCDGARLAGVITDRDITCRVVAPGMTPAAVAAGDIMSKPPLTAAEDDSIETATGLMEEFRVRRLPVLNAAGALTGIVSLAEVAANMPSNRVSDLIRSVSMRRDQVPA